MCHISREKSGTTPGGMKTISFQQAKSAPTIPVVYETYVILRVHLDIQPLSDNSRIGVSYARKIGLWHMHYTQLESVTSFYLYAD